MTATPSSTAIATAVTGLEPGTWSIDTAHSAVAFSVRHMMVSKVRGRFTRFEGEITIGEDPLASSVTATIDLGSVDTGNEKRDEHVRSADFFDVATHPTATYRSTTVRREGDGYVVDGDLTLHGVTRQVPLRLEPDGVGRDPWGNLRSGFTASAEINRSDFGISIAMPMEGGGVVVGEKVNLTLEIEAVLQAGEQRRAA